MMQKNTAISLGLVAIGIYIYNIFDAISSKGEKRYAEAPQENDFKFTLNEKLQLCFSIGF